MEHASRTRLLQLCREPIGQLFYPSFLRLVLRLNVVERLVFAHEQILDGLRTHDAIKARCGWPNTSSIFGGVTNWPIWTSPSPLRWPLIGPQTIRPCGSLS